jgi:hypothetical protein
MGYMRDPASEQDWPEVDGDMMYVFLLWSIKENVSFLNTFSIFEESDFSGRWLLSDQEPNKLRQW